MTRSIALGKDLERIRSMVVGSRNYCRWMIWRKSSWINLTENESTFSCRFCLLVILTPSSESYPLLAPHKISLTLKRRLSPSFLASSNDYGQRMTPYSSVPLLPNKQSPVSPSSFNPRLKSHLRIVTVRIRPRPSRLHSCTRYLADSLTTLTPMHSRRKTMHSFLNCRLRCRVSFEMRLRVVMNLSPSCPDTTRFSLPPGEIGGIDYKTDGHYFAGGYMDLVSVAKK
jgi:hypothetical protein